MSHRLIWTSVVSAGTLLGTAGCEHCGVPRAQPLPPPMYEPCPPPVNLPPHPLMPVQAAPIPTVPPGAVVPQSSVPPAAVPAPPTANAAPPVVGAEIRGYNAVPPANPNPEVLTPAEPPPTPKLSPPIITEEPPAAPPLPAPDTTHSAKPATADDAAFPVGIPQFSVASDGVTAGLKPSVYGGLDWLQANHYRAVLHIKAPAEDDSSDRPIIERYGLRYRALEVSPKTLCRADAGSVRPPGCRPRQQAALRLRSQRRAGRRFMVPALPFDGARHG